MQSAFHKRELEQLPCVNQLSSSIFYIQLGSPNKRAGHTGSGYTKLLSIVAFLMGPLTVDIGVPLVVDEYFP